MPAHVVRQLLPSPLVPMNYAVVFTALAVAALLAPGWAAAQAEPTYTEQYRPQYHFTPAVNWMNDPNGMVYLDGEYHLFYQYNPFGDTWGHMSWGHAVSRDLVHWEELPVALPEEDGVMVFSGSAVVDWNNTSGFGTETEPPMVAVYSGAHDGGQDQRIAYSTDRGRTWTKYDGNPVLDHADRDFRDPKVFWYKPDQKWVMVVALSLQHKVQFYSSPDLKTWTHLSNFGPAGAVSGIWECPDLFELPVDGDPNRKRWVLLVNLNPGGPAGGSAGQYFLGEFDGTAFRADPEFMARFDGSAPMPAGVTFADFEGADYGGWAATGTAFGGSPARGALEGQNPVGGYQGAGLVNTFRGGDAAVGTLTSPTFNVERPYVHFLVGGGRHPDSTAVNLVVNGEVVRSTTGRDTEALEWASWDVRDLRGRRATIEVVDRHTGGWGHVNVDHVVFGDEPMAAPSRSSAAWLDYGSDFYATVSWSGVPETDGDRLLIGWMSDWRYANEIPTSPWRSAQSLPRRATLRTVDGAVQLVQQPAHGLQTLRRTQRHIGDLAVPEGTMPLAEHGIEGEALELIAEFEVGTADSFGLKVRTGDGEETLVGYDVAAGEVFVDRMRSGDAGFHPEFAARHSGPLDVRDGRVRLHVFVDWSSLEVFGGRGQTTLTDQIFPASESDGVALFSEGGSARLVSLDVWDLVSAWGPETSTASTQ